MLCTTLGSHVGTRKLNFKIIFCLHEFGKVEDFDHCCNNI